MTMKVITSFTQMSPEWFEYKLGKFSATDGQAISANGAGLISLVYEKVAERLTGKFKEVYTNEDILRGIEKEEAARSAYELETGLSCKKVGLIEMTKDIVCSPDALVGEEGLLEIKNPNDANYVKYLYERKIETKYVWQMQFQLMVSERQWVDFMMHNDNFPKLFVIERVQRDEAAIVKLREGLTVATARMAKILKRV